MSFVTTEGHPYLEIARIVRRPGRDSLDLNDILVVCPDHHRLMDSRFSEFSAKSLRTLKAKHEIGLIKTRPLSAVESEFTKLFKRPLSFWESNKDCDNEDIWQTFLEENPHVLATLLPGDYLQFGRKVLVGGKDDRDQNGGKADFAYVPSTYHRLTIVEIKTPKAALLGSKYRNQCHRPSAELGGSIVQSLHYIRLAQSEFEHLSRKRDPRPKLTSINAVLIIGNRETLDNDCKENSFELIRSGLNNVQIITFDEVFAKIGGLLRAGGGK
ncbi:DUF4263 domain-containing protein [Rhizobium lusitanum]|uniref:DUF4263 domain-containing protein n=1 Tax=Rhizobium lusitanum TaxID=293958 RepID=A0A6L9U852_9HYPH|nr:DUF4263 domain-containing protein [Rhizobium lusitanum]